MDWNPIQNIKSVSLVHSHCATRNKNYLPTLPPYPHLLSNLNCPGMGHSVEDYKHVGVK